ncbi:MAG: DNA-binding protein [Verrucomicrobia bacterium]|nr:MAG: DNA-binding protein [Verrucomicrobiota bacterium]PYL94654.1 MAG: DNA-binding protein [Verrucomicrobiota bacterium]
MSKSIVPVHRIARSILVLRGEKVLLDVDLARLYGVITGNLNKAVQRNRERFPADFMFQLTAEEARNLKFQFGISSWGGLRTRPYAFTEQGVAMLSSVLKSKRAVKVNIAIMRAFVKLRETLETNRKLARKFEELEKRVGKHDEDISGIIEAIRQLIAPPKQPRREIGFHVREKSARYRTRNGR